MEKSSRIEKGITRESIKFAWNKFKENWLPLAGIALVYAVINYVPELFKDNTTHMYNPKFVPVNLILSIIAVIISYGTLKISIKLARNEKLVVSDMWNINFNAFLKYVVAYITYFLIVFGGLILLIVPGVVWAFKYIFLPYLVVDKNMKIKEAMKKSGEITYNCKIKIFILSVALAILNILGMLVFGLGVLVTLPITWIAMGYVYNKLLNENGESQENDNSETPMTETTPQA